MLCVFPRRPTSLKLCILNLGYAREHPKRFALSSLRHSGCPALRVWLALLNDLPRMTHCTSQGSQSRPSLFGGRKHRAGAPDGCNGCQPG